MHELSISRSIAEVVLREAEKAKARRVISVEVEIGELSLLNPDQVEFCLGAIFKDTIADGVKIKIKKVEPFILCRRCGYEGGIKIEDDPIFHLLFPIISCPLCSSEDIAIERGRECRIRRIELETG